MGAGAWKPQGKVMYQVSTRACSVQEAIRRKVEERQDSIMKMQERTYKKFQNEVKKFLSTAEREAAEKYLNLWGNRLAGVKQTRNDIYLKVCLLTVRIDRAVSLSAAAISKVDLSSWKQAQQLYTRPDAYGRLVLPCGGAGGGASAAGT